MPILWLQPFIVIIGFWLEVHVKEPHRDSFAGFQGSVEGASMMVTLEPCTHYGLTPPCREAIIQSGIKDVVFAIDDSDPRVRSNVSDDRYKEAGISVRKGLLSEEARRLNDVYFHVQETQRPFVTLKAGISLDGRIAMASGESRGITSDASLKRVHAYRAQVDAIVIGQRTLEVDDPSLSVRYNQLGPEHTPPARIVVCKRSVDESMLNRFQQHQDAGPVILASTLEQSSGSHHYWQLAASDGIDWDRILDRCYKAGYRHLLLEGGAGLFTSALEAGIVQKCLFFIAPKLLAEKDALSVVNVDRSLSLKESISLHDIRVSECGDDILVEGYL